MKTSNKKHVKGKFMLFICIFGLALIAVFSFFRVSKPSPHIITISPTPTLPPHAIATGDGSYIQPTTISGQMKFVSPKLGISFLYGAEGGSTKILAREDGDKVYLYNDLKFNHRDGSPYTYREGIYVEIFDKNPQDDLATAIRKTVLKNYAEKDCFVRDMNDIDQNPHSPYNGGLPIKAMIGFPHDDLNWAEPVFKTFSIKCPGAYKISGNSTRYFGFDKNHPDKFFFFEISGGNFPSGIDPITWDKTISFIK